MAIIELAHHNEVVRAYAISLVSQEIKISIFTTSWILEQYYDLRDHPLITWHIKEQEESSFQFIHRVKEPIDKCSCVILTSLEDGEKGFLKNSFSIASYLVVHDVHTLFEYKNNLNFSGIKSLGRVLKHIFFGILKMRALSASTFDYFILPSGEVYKYVQSKPYFNNRFLVAPFAINDEISELLDHDCVRITIPGIVDDKSRDYLPVIHAISTLEPLKAQVQLCLLGKPSSKYGRSVVDKFNELKSESVDILSFNQFIPQKQFDKIMRETDFLICPMNKVMKFGPVNEKNGFSCVSGNMNDIIRFGLPSLIPDYYPLPANLKNVITQYRDASNLNSILTEWIDKGIYNHIKSTYAKEAFNNNSKYKLGKLLLEKIQNNITSS